MLKKKVYADPGQRLHDSKGRFVKKPKSLTNREKSFLDLETPYFSQDDNKPQTYNRTGLELEIERDGQDIFDDVFGWGLVISAVIIWIKEILF